MVLIFRCHQDCDNICIDWGVDLSVAKAALPNHGVSGNMDPSILLGPEADIRSAVRDCIVQGGGAGAHLFNVGHGVMQGTPEEAVGWLVDEVKTFRG